MSTNTTALVTPDLHDGLLLGISLDGERRATLLCKSVDQEEYELVLSGVERLRADNFLEGNTIFEVLLHRGAFPPHLLRKVLGYDDGAPEPFDSELANNPHWTNAALVELSCSYGCELLALTTGLITVRQQGVVLSHAEEPVSV